MSTTQAPTRILVVDDEKVVRDFVVSVLNKRGYISVAAASGEAALSILRQEPNRIDILLTDIYMPGMSGTDLATAARAVAPDLDVIYMTGFTSEATVQDALLCKPFTSRELLAAIEGELGSFKH